MSGTTLSFAFSATVSSVLKHVSPEADKITLTLTRSNMEQGVFAIANNYGPYRASGLRPRGGERKGSLSKFSQTLTQLEADKKEKKNRRRKRNVQWGREGSARHGTAAGPPAQGRGGPSPRGVGLWPQSRASGCQLYLAPQWRREETVQTLSAFCLYIGMLALNGVSGPSCTPGRGILASTSRWGQLRRLCSSQLPALPLLPADRHSRHCLLRYGRLRSTRSHQLPHHLEVL